VRSALAPRRPLSAWWTPGPGPDERLGSVVLRAAELYGTTPERLVGELVGDTHPAVSDVDGAGAHVVTAIARAIHAKPTDLWRCRLPDHPRLLAPGARLAYCPACWSEDRAAGQPFTFRREWAGVLRTLCRGHQTPLRLFGQAAKLPGSSSTLLERPEPGTFVSRCAIAIDAFAQVLEHALFDSGSWPADWRLSARECRDLLLKLTVNVNDGPDLSLMCRFIDPSVHPRDLRTARHLLVPCNGEPWGAFRAIDDPAVRRAALWLVAWWTRPDWDQSLSPAWAPRCPKSIVGGLIAGSMRAGRRWRIHSEAIGSKPGTR
jgi:hypothetical protein